MRTYFSPLRLVLVLVLLSAAPLRAETPFIDGLDDIPLMPLLAVEDDRSMVFDSPTGRIADITAKGPPTVQAVQKFYGAALPQLGWEAGTDPNTFIREGERLTLEFTDAEMSNIFVRFRLTPLP